MRVAWTAARRAGGWVSDLRASDMEQVRIDSSGSLAERFKAPVLKTGEDVSPP